MTAYELHELLTHQCRMHGTNVPVCIATTEPTSDGLEVDDVYTEVETVEPIITPGGKWVIALRV
jgi:hypothetical protein